MEILLKEKVDLMIQNFNKLKDELKWESNLVKHFAAMSYALEGKSIDSNKIKEIKQYIKENTGFFSQFRGSNITIIATLLSLEKDYKKSFINVQNVYKKMKEKGFRSSEYLTLTAYNISKESSNEKIDEVIDETEEFYNGMKKNHFWLTSKDDYIYAGLLATSKLEVNSGLKEIETCYKLLNQKGFTKGNDLQSLSHILALGEENSEEKCSKALKIYNELIENKCRLKYDALATIGVIALVTSNVYETVEEIKEVYDYMYGRDGYGFWSIDKSMRTMLASTLVVDIYIDKFKSGILKTNLASSINSIIIAQQQAIIIGACIAGAATTNNN